MDLRSVMQKRADGDQDIRHEANILVKGKVDWVILHVMLNELLVSLAQWQLSGP